MSAIQRNFTYHIGWGSICIIYLLLYLVSSVFLFIESYVKLNNVEKGFWTITHLSGVVGWFLMSCKIFRDLMGWQRFVFFTFADFVIMLWIFSVMFGCLLTDQNSRIIEVPFVTMFTSLIVFFAAGLWSGTLLLCEERSPRATNILNVSSASLATSVILEPKIGQSCNI